MFSTGRPAVVVCFVLVLLSGCVGDVSGLPDAGVGDGGAGDAAVAAGRRDGGDDGGRGIEPIAGFGSGAQRGSFDASSDVWEPGRDDAGRVNQSSWDLVPAGRWVTVAGTRIEDLTPAIDALVPGWSAYTPNLNWDNWTNSWNGLAADVDGARLWLFGGGHSNGTNNGLYRFDGYAMRWAIAATPSDPATWSPAYRASAGGGATGNPDSQEAYLAALDAGTLRAVDDWFYDQTPSDNKPTARHTYSGLVYLPDHQELVMMVRRMWRFDLRTGQWVQRRLFFDDLVSGYLDGEGIIAFYDEAKQEITATSNGSTYGGNGRFVRFNRQTETWVSGSSTGDGSPWQRLASADARFGRTIAFFQPPVAMTHDGFWMQYSLDAGVVASSGNDLQAGVGFEYAGGLSQGSFAKLSRYYDGTGALYVPPLNRYWLQTLMNDDQIKWVEVDPTTSPKWTLRPLDFTGAVPSPQLYGKRRAFYVPPLKAVLCLSASNRDLSVYKLQ